MKNLDQFVAITDLDANSTQSDIVDKVNKLIAIINDLVPNHIGDDGIVDEA